MGCVTSAPNENKISPNTKREAIGDDDSEDSLDNNLNSEIPNSKKVSLTKRNHFDTHFDRYYLIQILSATDIPKLDKLSESDPYVILKIFDESGRQKGENIQSLYRMDNPNPTWNCYRTFCASEFHDSLVFEIWEKDFTDNDDYIGSGEIKISELFVNINMDNNRDKTYRSKGYIQMNVDDDNDDDIDDIDDMMNDDDDDDIYQDIKDDDDEDCLQEIIINLKKEKHQKRHETKLYFKLFALQCSPNKIEKKTIFFIRHGESEWNAAQQNKEIHKMYKQIDHPLNNDGIEQALKLNDIWKSERNKSINIDNIIDIDDNGYIEDLDDFLNGQIIYTSPLCRATQTAILTLLDHPCLDKKGLIYARNLREIKTIGGADSLANKTGIKQYKKAIDNIIKYKTNLNDKINKIHIDYNDSGDQQKWWSSSIDTKSSFYDRLTDFMYYLRYSNESIIICVGHSLWLQSFFKKYVNIKDIHTFSSKNIIQDISIFNDDDNSEQKQNENEKEKESALLMNELTNKKIQNAGCVRVDIEFSDSFENGLKIQDVRLLFGTQLIDKKKKL